MTATATIQLQMPNQDHLFEHLRVNAQYANPKNVIREGTGKDRRVIICGAGPSLADHHETIRNTPAHQIWAANSALPYMIDHHLPVTHGITVDMGEEMHEDPYEWERTFPVRYLVSSGVSPKLMRHLRKANREYRMFHSYLGIKNPEGWEPPANWRPPSPTFATYEMYLYTTIYPPTVQVGYGLNTVPRAICLALWMGFKHITVFGADCACRPGGSLMPPIGDPRYAPWLDTLVLYADGRTAAKYGPEALVTQGILEGRTWHTRPDMIISARHLLDMATRYPQLELVGDTLPNVLRRMPAEYLDRMPNLTGHGSVSGFELNLPLDTSPGEAP